MAQNRSTLPAHPCPDRRMGRPHKSERRERRSPLTVLLRVCGFSAGGRIFSEIARTLDISRSGCCVRLKTPPLGEHALAIEVIPHREASPAGGVQMLYQVVWQARHGQGWEVGLMALGTTDLLQVAFASCPP